MKYKHLTRANVDISLFTLGTWGMSGNNNFGPFDRQQAIESIRTAIDNGVNHIDTAPVYGNGYAEQLVGEALQDGYREKVYISTKFGVTPNVMTRIKRVTSFENIMREVQSSLLNLKTDYIDFYFVHWPDLNTPISETMSALNLLKKLGKIKYIGVSNFSIEQIQEAEKYGQVDVIQNEFSMVNQTNKELMEWASQQGIDCFTYGSLGSGILGGKYRELPKFETGDTRVTFYDYFKEPKFSKIMNLLQVMDDIALKHNCPVSQVAINWCAQNPFVSTTLIGASKKDHVLENCKTFNWSLDETEIILLNQTIVKEEIEI